MLYKTWQRWAILFIGLLENLVFSGSILGWSALNYMLKQEGIFSSLCHHDSSNLYSVSSRDSRHEWSNSSSRQPSSSWKESKLGVNQHFVSWNDDLDSVNSSSSPVDTSFLVLKDYPLIDSFINYSVLPQMPSVILSPPLRSPSEADLLSSSDTSSPGTSLSSTPPSTSLSPSLLSTTTLSLQTSIQGESGKHLLTSNPNITEPGSKVGSAKIDDDFCSFLCQPLLKK